MLIKRNRGRIRNGFIIETTGGGLNSPQVFEKKEKFIGLKRAKYREVILKNRGGFKISI